MSGSKKIFGKNGQNVVCVSHGKIRENGTWTSWDGLNLDGVEKKISGGCPVCFSVQKEVKNFFQTMRG